MGYSSVRFYIFAELNDYKAIAVGNNVERRPTAGASRGGSRCASPVQQHVNPKIGQCESKLKTFHLRFKKEGKELKNIYYRRISFVQPT